MRGIKAPSSKREEAKSMGIFNKCENYEDGVYARRVARGEVPKPRTEVSRAMEIVKLRNEVQELSEENRKLRKAINIYQERLQTMEFVHSMDELIDTMKEEKATKPASSDLFDALLKFKPTASDSDATNMLSPENSIASADIPDNAEFESDEVAQNEVGWNDEER